MNSRLQTTGTIQEFGGGNVGNGDSPFLPMIGDIRNKNGRRFC
jgi:hypothetical protein